MRLEDDKVFKSFKIKLLKSNSKSLKSLKSNSYLDERARKRALS
jgi:hypothetical protein